MGHVQQSITIAQELGSAAQVRFLTKSGPAVLAKIRESGFEADRLDSDMELLRTLVSADPDIVIFDKLDVAEELARDIKARLRARLVIFTNLTEANRYADVAVTADIGSRFQNVTFTDEATKTRYYYGPKYWVLRREFHEYRRRGKRSRAPVERVLLMFGGSDPADITSVALEQLLQREHTPAVDVILGAHFGHEHAVREVLDRHSSRRATVTLHRNISNVAEMMFDSDLVLASPGLSAFEALCVGTPVIVVPQDELQRDTYRGFMRMLERDELGRLGGMIDRAEFTYPDDEHIAAMEIGEGVAELKQVILNSPERPE